MILNKIHYQNIGKEVVILLHGFLGSHEIWEGFVSKLSSQFEVINFDLPSHGKSIIDKEMMTMEEMAKRIENEISKENIKVFHVVGHSMGGYVGLELLNQYPDRIKSLTLLNSTAAADSELKKADRLRAIRVFDLSPSVFVKEAIINLFYPPNIETFSEEVKNLQEIALSTPVIGAQASLRGMRERKDHTSLINSTKTPIQFISGIYDSTVPFSNIEDQIRSENIKLVRMEHSGHMSFVEEREKCLSSIINFIKGNAS